MESQKLESIKYLAGTVRGRGSLILWVYLLFTHGSIHRWNIFNCDHRSISNTWLVEISKMSHYITEIRGIYRYIILLIMYLSTILQNVIYSRIQITMKYILAWFWLKNRFLLTCIISAV